MPESYTPKDWSSITPIDEASLDNIETGIEAIDDRVAAVESGKAATSHTHASTDLTSALVPTARLGSGTASSTTFLRGDQTYAVPAGGSGASSRVALIVAASNALQSVKDGADYVCDGVNDQVEINAALSGGSKYVQLSAGDFYQGNAPIRVTSRSTLRGVGKATRIHATTQITGGGTEDGSGYDFGWGAQIESYDVQTHRMTISDIDLDGAYKNCHGLYIRTSGISDVDASDAWNQTGAEGFDAVHHITNIYAHEQLGRSFHLDGHGGVYVEGCRAWNNGTSGNQAAGWYISIIDSFFVNCESGTPEGHAWEVVDANNHFTNCKGWFAGKAGFYIGAEGVRNVFASCVAQDCKEHGWHIQAGPNSLTACGADSNSYDFSPSGAITGNTFNGFQLDATSQVTLSGCWATDKNENSRGRRQQYGYGMVNTATRTMIHGTGHNNAVGPLTGGSRTNVENIIQIVAAAGASVVYSGNNARLYQPVLSTAPTDAEIPINGMSVWVDNTTNTLTFRIRKNDGTYFTKTL